MSVRTAAEPAPPLRRALGFRDLFLFYLVTTFSLRWIATAAAAGPSAIVIWVLAAAGLFVPLVFTVLELSTRYPEEGGIYVWSKQAFGPFAGFMAGWSYWSANLPYFPSLLYFAAANALFIGGPSWAVWSTSSVYFVIASLTGLGLAVTLNIVGLGVGKWLNNVGALAGWIPAVVLLALGAMSWSRFGSATDLHASAFIPATHLKDVIFWSTMAFAFGGVESGSIMGEEIQLPRRTVPRAILAAGVMMTLLYIAATFSVLLAIPKEQVSGLQGIMQALESMTSRVHAGWLVGPLAVCVTVNALGGVGGWFAATARLPFVAGMDRVLPPAFGVLHPRWRTPHIALLVQAAVSALFIWLGQAGTSVRGAYEVLVSTSIITYFVPFLFMFAAMIRLQREPSDASVMRVPGGARVAMWLALLGFLTTTAAIVLACVPAVDEPNRPLAVIKTVGASVGLLTLGVVVYLSGRRRGNPR
jgi:amino acid transporter